jgi:hypothetical protein
MATTRHVICSDRPFNQVIVMLMEAECAPFKVVDITKLMADGRTLQHLVREEHGFDIAQHLTPKNRLTAVVVSGWLSGGTAHAYIFVRIQLGK